jgi:hypothetical protein
MNRQGYDNPAATSNKFALLTFCQHFFSLRLTPAWI